VRKKHAKKLNSREKPYIGFCRESIALQDSLGLSSRFFDLRKCERKKDETLLILINLLSCCQAIYTKILFNLAETFGVDRAFKAKHFDKKKFLKVF